jgi:hypothetical protein
MKDIQKPSSTKPDWRQLIDQWQQSGLSGSQFCTEHNLVYHQFMYWKQKFGKSAVSSPADKRSSFAKVVPQAESGSGLTLNLPNGIVIRNISDLNVDLVGRLLEWL